MRPAWGRWYAYFLCGLLGGTIAWFLSIATFKLITPAAQQPYKVLSFTLLHAAFFGLVMGGMVSLIDRWWEDSWLSAIIGQPATLLMGCFLGMLLSLTGHFLGYTFFDDLAGVIGPLGGRLLGFGIAGLIGVLDGVHHQSASRMRNGAIGGLAGGILAGLIYNLMAVYVQVPLISQNTLAFAFPLWGAAILLGVSATNWVATDAVLQGVQHNESPKYRVGFVKQLLSDQANTIGASHKCTFKVAMDQLMAPIHASVQREKGKWVIQPREGLGLISVNQQEINQSRELRDGDVLQLGQTSFLFKLSKS